MVELSAADNSSEINVTEFSDAGNSVSIMLVEFSAAGNSKICGKLDAENSIFTCLVLHVVFIMYKKNLISLQE